jgi:DHA3 family tetracycline resistance protein-like MFS transporter
MRRLPATSVFYGLEFVLSLPAFVVVAVYLVREVHLSPLQLILVGTVMEAAVFVFEVPTGIVADTYSRRASLVVSFVLQGAAWILIGAVPDVGSVLIAWALWGFGYTFMSGAYEAWITDEVGAENVGPVFMRGARISYAGALVGLAGGVGLALVSLRLSIIAAGSVVVLGGLVSAFVMPEHGFTRRPRAERARALVELRRTALTGGRFVRAQPLILMMLGITFFAGMSSEALDRLTEAHFIRDIGLPKLGSLDQVVWFGIFGAAALAIGLVGATVLIRRFERATTVSLARTLLVMTAVLMAAEVSFALAAGLGLAIAALLVARLMRSLVNPLYMTWLNQQITDSSVRATVISITGQADAIGQAGGGPALGAVGNVWGIRAALVAGACVLAPALGLYSRAVRHRGAEPELEALPALAPVGGSSA